MRGNLIGKLNENKTEKLEIGEVIFFVSHKTFEMSSEEILRKFGTTTKIFRSCASVSWKKMKIFDPVTLDQAVSNTSSDQELNKNY
jgi:hypothetical protein